MSAPYYITTPIYYVNDAPHLGHAYTTIAADSMARFHRARGRDVRFLTGTDEHGQKVEEAAGKKGLTPQALADSVVQRFRDTWVNLDVSHDDFIRTTEERHKKVVAEMWRRIHAAGDIYLHKYEGWYCVSCEAYYPESQLEGKNCPVHKKEARWVSEPSYFFKMSKYQDALLKHFEENPTFVAPENYRNEVVSFVKSGLRDISVSRTTFSWGVPVPDDPEHVIYVWIDALTNYLSALGDIGSEQSDRYWPADCHLIGKDILRFHAVYWPCMLMSAGIPLPKQVYVHGWWTVRGEKISKSMPATRVDPNLLAADIGADSVRYFVLREIPLGNDGDFSYEALIGRYNADLANDLGNLFARSTTMAVKFADGAVPKPGKDFSGEGPHKEVRQVAADTIAAATPLYESLTLSRALESIWRLVRETNRYIDSCQPWTLAKDPARADELAYCVRTFLEASYTIARLIAPVMPATAKAMLTRLGLSEEKQAAALASWPDANSFGGELEPGQSVQKGDPLFPRLDEARANELLSRWLPEDAVAPAAEAAKATGKEKKEKSAEANLISFDQFSKLDLRVAKIETAEAVPKAKKLLKLTVSLGDETRQVVAGIAERYSPEELPGRHVIFLANLKPAKIRGVESQGMILAAGEKDVLALSALDTEVPPGTVVR